MQLHVHGHLSLLTYVTFENVGKFQYWVAAEKAVGSVQFKSFMVLV